jgi:hypothetical protein
MTGVKEVLQKKGTREKGLRGPRDKGLRGEEHRPMTRGGKGDGGKGEGDKKAVFNR